VGVFKRKSVKLFVSMAALAASAFAVHAATPAPAKKQVVTGPVAVYWMNTTTSTGMSNMMNGAGGRPSMGSIMNGMMGGGNGPAHSMTMELGSSQTTTAEPAGDHLPPAGLNAGDDLPLYYKAIKAGPVEPTEATPEQPHDYQPPKGKILIFWGCGEHAPKNQPVVIDLSTLSDPAARVQMMKQMMPLTNTIALDPVHPPSPQTWKSYGEWPNQKSRKGIGADASLIGAHTVKANYAPQIDFTLGQGQDFLPGINVTGNEKAASGAVPLAWSPVAGSKGFVVTAVGGGQDTVVMWTSAQVQTAWMGLAPDYLTANDITKLQAAKALLPGDATTCTVPAEVVNSAQALIYGITAYGGETNIAYPPRPSDPNTPWNILWETKVRYRSITGGMLGQSMGSAMMGGMGGPSQPASTGDQGGQQKKKKGFGLGDMVKSAAGSFIP
jgi:hypothetical protein